MSYQTLARELAGFGAAFAIMNRDTGEMLLEASADDAANLQSLLERDALAEDVHGVAGKMANAITNAIVGEIKITVTSEDPATCLAVFERMVQPIRFAKSIGILTSKEQMADICHFGSGDLPTIDCFEMAQVAEPVFAILHLAKSAEATEATHPSTNTIQ